MKGVVVVKPGVVEVRNDVPEPRMDDYHALVKNLACGICNGTDWKVVEGCFKGFDTYPAVLGHESVGIVIEVGRKVKSFKKGDLVLRSMLEDGLFGDGSIYSGWGSFAEYGLVGDWKALEEDGITNFPEYYFAQQVLPPDFDPVDSTMLITFKEVMTATQAFGFERGQSIVICGAGPVGLSFVRIARILGMGPIIVSEPSEERRSKAIHMGADFVINPLSGSLEKLVRDIVPDGVDYFLDAVGINELLSEGLRVLKFGGKVCTYGISPRSSTLLDWEKAPFNWTIQFVQWPAFREEMRNHGMIVALTKFGTLNPKDFITHVIPLEEIKTGLELIRSKKALKVVVKIE